MTTRRHPTVARLGLRAAAARAVAMELLEVRQLLSANPEQAALLLQQAAPRATPAVRFAATIATPQSKLTKHSKHSKRSRHATTAGLTSPSGYTPARMRHAYGIDNVSLGSGITPDGTGMTIAIVDAYNVPTIASDLHNFDVQFGLADPPSFKVVAQDGSTNYPQVDPNAGKPWTMETCLDVEWVHAMAPGANILLVEATTDDLNDLINQAVDYARHQPGVVAVSMSWGASEVGQNPLTAADEAGYDPYFTTPAGHAPVAFFAATGDTGGTSLYPAYSPGVTAIGGTSLNSDASGNYISETGWSASGGGISLFEAQPAYQQGVVTQSSTKRTNPDVGFAADPTAGGVSVYDATRNAGTPGNWESTGGTSLGTPVWAAFTAIADQLRASAGLAPISASALLGRIYSMPAADFHDITSGGNASYQAVAGYDLVTGRGTPIAPSVVPDLIAAGPVAYPVVIPPQTGSVGAVDVHFNQPMDPTSFNVAADVQGFTGPGGSLMGQISGFTWTDSTTLHISFTPQTRAGTYTLTLSPQILSAATETPLDENGNYTAGETSDTFTATFSINATIANRAVFYNDSSYDNGDPAANAADDAAIAPDKSALLPGQTAGFANYTSFFHGLNGVMIDVNGLANGAALSAAGDFSFETGTSSDPSTWTAAPAPAITVRPGAGAGGSDRIEIVWSDNTLQNAWLQVTVKATANTGLASPDVFYFGNLIGDTGNNSAAAQVTSADVAMTKSLQDAAATLTSPVDFNRNGLITSADVAIVKFYLGGSLPLFTAPAAAPAVAAATSATGSTTTTAGATTTPSTSTSPATTAATARGKRHTARHSAIAAATAVAASPFSVTPLPPMMPRAFYGPDHD